MHRFYRKRTEFLKSELLELSFFFFFLSKTRTIYIYIHIWRSINFHVAIFLMNFPLLLFYFIRGSRNTFDISFHWKKNLGTDSRFMRLPIFPEKSWNSSFCALRIHENSRISFQMHRNSGSLEIIPAALPACHLSRHI